MKQRSLFIALLAVVAILCLLFLGRQNSKEGTRYQHNEGTIFGTLYHTKYLYGTDLQAELEAELQKVDASLSMFNPQSTISRINRNETDEVDEMLREVMELSFTIYKATDGAFDPTVAPLVNAWGFGFKSGNLPDSTQVDSLLALVGLSHVHLNGNKLIKDNHNIKNFMVEIGGEIIAEGVNEKGEAWRIGINKPDDDSTSTNMELQDVIELTGKAIATSGNYRNFYIKDGRKIAHTINPKTGYPAQQDILSSTVIASTCAEADAFATAFMVLGTEGAKQVLEKQPQLETYFITND